MKNKSLGQIVKFCIVGLMNTAVDYIVFFVALSVLNADKNLSQIIATAFAMTGSYIANRHWTFGEKGRGKKRQIAKFVTTNLISMCCTIIFMNFFHDVLRLHEGINDILSFSGVNFRFDGDIGVMLCKIAASMLSLIVNFVGNKFWVFKKVEKVEM